MRGWQRWVVFLVVTLVLAVLPFVLPNNYAIGVANRILINAIAVIGLNLLMGYAGQVSLGHAGFIGIGAYASAVLPTHFAWHALSAMVGGMVFAGLLAFVVARPVLRLRGHMLAMATLGLGIIVSMVLSNESRLTGGPDGMAVLALSIGGWSPTNELHWYALFAAALLISIWIAQNIVDSPMGRALRALHGAEAAASTSGINVPKYKARVFVISAVFASFAGSISAHYIGFITPQVSSLLHSIELVTMVVVGGMASVYGSVLGAALLTVLPQVLADFEGLEKVIFGALLILIIVLMPGGLMPTIARHWAGRRAHA